MVISIALQIPTVAIPLILAALPLLLAAFIGFIFGELKALRETRRSDKAVLKRVLYYQLELWAAIRRAEPSIIIMKVFKATDLIIHKLGGHPGLLERAFKTTSNQDKQKFFSVIKRDLNEDLLQSYEKSLNELASVDPILSYRLTSRMIFGSATEVNTMLDNLILKFDPLFLASEPNARLLEKMKDYYNEKGKEWAVQNLKSDISSVAWQISFRTWLRIWWMIAKDRFWVRREIRDSMLYLFRLFIDHSAELKAKSEPVQTEVRPPQSSQRHSSPQPS